MLYYVTKDVMALKIQESAENYLETILMLSKARGVVRSVDIAAELDFSKPSVSVAMKNLRERGHIVVDADGFITLTQRGREIAESVYERHRILTDCLVALGVDEKTALDDACRIEHVISEQSFAKIREGYLRWIKDSGLSE
jgi:Mn-dependent DtxR family transcriptional regulator